MPEPDPREPDRGDPGEPEPSRRNALIALAVVAALVVGGWFLSDVLAAVSRIQDCVMSGRRNCVVFH